MYIKALNQAHMDCPSFQEGKSEAHNPHSVKAKAGVHVCPSSQHGTMSALESAVDQFEKSH